jgi:hypothetical protein
VLFFVLGLIAAIVQSDLKFPAALSETLSMYLLIAIGLKGGLQLSHYSLSDLLKPIGGTLLLGVCIPVIVYVICQLVRLDVYNAAALAATYGSVSIVTYGAAVSILEHQQMTFEPFMHAMVVILESPAIFISILLLRARETKTQEHPQAGNVFPLRTSKAKFGHIVTESLVGKSVLLMVGALCVGMLVPQSGEEVIRPLFIDLYKSVLILFLLGMGLMAGERLAEVRDMGIRVLVLAIFFPMLFGSLGVLVGYVIGLSPGGTALMGVLGASASYIAAPAAIRSSIPQANPAMYIGMSLGITFPFNLIIGMPLFIQMAQGLGTRL